MGCREFYVEPPLHARRLVKNANQKFYDPLSKSRTPKFPSLGVFTDMSHIDTASPVFLTSSGRILHISCIPRFGAGYRSREEVGDTLYRVGGQFQKGSTHVELGAFVMVPGGDDFTGMMREAQPHGLTGFANPRAPYSSRMPILGNDVLQSWTDRVRKLGVQSLWLASGAEAATSALAEFARQGIERLLVIELKSYAEMDLADLLRFHCERRSPVTEAHDSSGQLGVRLLDRPALRASGEQHESSCSATESGQTPYQFSGYSKRILSARERQELVGDGLTGACAMRPLGTQIREQVWIGEGVKVATSARILGPTYIGARTIIRDGATIGPFASVERDCVVDCGTTVERSTVLPDTYLAPGLLIRNGLVDGGHLEHLGWGAAADLESAGLGSHIPRRGSWRKAFSPAPTDASSRGDNNAFAPNFALSSAASQPWLQVQL